MVFDSGEGVGVEHVADAVGLRLGAGSLGGEIDNPRWLAQWSGKQLYDRERKLRIAVVKGGVDRDSPESRHQVDAISGATLTSRGVSNLMRYWLGDHGFGPYLSQLRSQGG